MLKKFQYIIVGAGLTLLIIVGVLATVLKNANANEVIHDSQAKVEQRSENVEIRQSENEATANQELLNQRETLMSEWQHNMTEQPGWLRTIVHYVQESEPSVMPGGIVIPSEYTLENWYLLDENQAITTMLGVMRDENGNMIQFGTFQDGNSYNSALDDVHEIDLVIDFLKNFGVSAFINQNNIVHQEIASQDGREILITTVREKFSPVPLDDLDGVLASGVVTQDVIDAQTGEPIRSSQTILLADGSERLLGKYDYVLVDRPTSLPQELDDLLQKGLNILQEAR